MARMKIFMNGRYLLLPVMKETPEKDLRIFLESEDGQERTEVTEFSCPAGVPDSEYQGYDFLSPLNMAEYANRSLIVEGDFPDWFWKNLAVSDELPDASANRPLLHAAPDYAWGNDPNGLVYHDGIYEFYYQYNPVNTVWMNMSWAHTRSADLLHWERSETVMLPTPDGTIYSGYGMVNEPGAFGLPKDALLFFYTQAGNNPHPWDTGKPFNQRLAYSLDGGTTLIRPERSLAVPAERESADGNCDAVPSEIHSAGGSTTLLHSDDSIMIPDPLGDTTDPRDPSIHWYGPGNFWYIVMYYGSYKSAIWKSEDLQHWNELQVLDLTEYKMRECSDMFSIERDDGTLAWIFWTADGYYLTGWFDGEKFVPDGVCRHAYVDSIAYAAQSYRGLGDRNVTVAWLRTRNEGCNYRSIYSLPREMKLSGDIATQQLHFLMIPEFCEQRQMAREILNERLTWQAASDSVLDLEIRAVEGPCSVKWEFPGLKLSYDAETGILTGDNECRHYTRYQDESQASKGVFELTLEPGLTDFSLIYDRGILEFTADRDRLLAYIELPAEKFGGEVKIEAEKRVLTGIYTVK